MPGMIAYIGLGANLGQAQVTLMAALAALAQLPDTSLIAHSSLYASAPVDATGEDYVNAVAQLHTQLAPEALLDSLQTIELQFGRVRSYQNAPRTLDLDLLLYDQQIIHTPRLQIPHPRMHQRAFVLLPLLEITADSVIPGHGSASAFLSALQTQVVRKIS